MYHLAPIGLSWGMKMQTELEQTQLEIAKLQLEQEHRKLAGLQKRQRVVDDLGAGAAAVGGAAKSGLRWAVILALGAVAGAIIGVGVVALMGAAAALGGNGCAAYPNADLWYRVGCVLGERQPLMAWFGVGGFLLGIVLTYREFRRTS